MVNEFLAEITQGFGIVLGLDSTASLYLMSFALAVCFGIIFGGYTRRPNIALGAFVGTLFLFALLDAFPLWALLLPISIIIILGVHFKDHGE